MNKVFVYFEQNTKKIQLAIFGSLLVLAFYGAYKNGFAYYFQGLLSFADSMKLLLFPLIGLLGAFFYGVILSKKLQFSLEYAIEGVLLALFMPVRFPIWCFVVLVILYFGLKNLWQKKLSTISLLCFIKVLSMVLSEFVFSIDYQNVIETSYPYLYGITDAFFGRGVGAYGTTSIFLILVCYAVFCSDYYYKRELPIYILGSFLLLETAYVLFVTHENLLLALLNSHIFFVSIVLAPMKNHSPAESKYLLIFGLFVGIGSFLLNAFFDFSDGIYIVLLFAQILWTLALNFQKLYYQKTLATQKD